MLSGGRGVILRGTSVRGLLGDLPSSGVRSELTEGIGKWFNGVALRNPDEQDGQRRGRWTPPRWIVHIALAWFIIGSVIGLLLETTVGPWWWVAYHGLTGGNGLGLIVYVNLGTYLIAEEFYMIIAHLNNLKDREEALAKTRREVQEARQKGRQEAREEARQEAREEARQEAREEVDSEFEAVRQGLTLEEMDSLPAAVRDLLERHSNNGNGAGGR